MKKKIVVILCFVLVFISSVTALSSEGVQNFILEIATDAEEGDFSFEIDSYDSEPVKENDAPLEAVGQAELFSINRVETTFGDVSLQIEAKGFGENEEARIKNNFISTAINYGMTDGELRYVKGLFEKGYDMDKVLEVYSFIRWTDCDYTMVESIYNEGIEHSDKENWVYDAYDRYFEREDDMLSVEDVAYYVSEGLTPEEIAGAYELSFAGEKTTKEMLGERLEGKTWNEIAASSLSEAPEAVVAAPEMSIDDVMQVRGVSVRQRKDFEEVADTTGERVEINREARNAERQRQIEKENMKARYRVEAPQEITAENRDDAVSYSGRERVFETEEIREEDLIPVEEPEVE